MLNLQEIKKNEKGHMQECFSTNNPRIKNVTFTYVGKEKDIDSFLKSLILDYGRKEKMVA